MLCFPYRYRIIGKERSILSFFDSFWFKESGFELMISDDASIFDITGMPVLTTRP